MTEQGIKIFPAFQHKETVYLKTDKDMLPRIVVSYKVFADGDVMYSLVQGTLESCHFDYEITREKIYTVGE